MVLVRRAVAAVLLCSLFVFAAATPALAQARDPFRPPIGGGAAPGGVTQPPATGGQGAVPPDTGGGLPRTGQDLVLLVAAALALMCAGGALRLTGRLLAT